MLVCRRDEDGRAWVQAPSVRITRLGIVTSRLAGLAQPTDTGFAFTHCRPTSPMGRYRRTYRQSACAFETTGPPVPATAPDPLGELVGTDMSGFAFTHCRRKAQWVATTGVWCPPRARRSDIQVYVSARPQATGAMRPAPVSWNRRLPTRRLDDNRRSSGPFCHELDRFMRSCARNGAKVHGFGPVLCQN